MKITDFAKQLKKLSVAIKEQIDAQFYDWDDSPTAIAERVAKVHDPVCGFEYFCRKYFPHYLRHPNQSQMHQYVFGRLPAILQDPNSQFDALAAPRGEAKSTIVTRLFSLYCIVTNKKRYIAIISNTYQQAAMFLQSIKTELEFNTRIKVDFPHAHGMGKIWREDMIITTNAVQVQVAGAGKALRGFVHEAYRPDLVLLDDLENDKNVKSPEQRDSLNEWLNSAVLALGVAGEKTDYFYIGTILHHDSVLNRTLNNKGWTTKLFKAISQYPDNMSLWDEYNAIFHAEGKDVARQFYLDNQEAMEKGAVVSWQSRPIFELMQIRARIGQNAFDTEYQNDPTAGDDAPFNNAINYWHELPPNLLYFGACDPSLGKAGASRDPSAIVIGGLDKTTGKLYIVVADIKKRLPDKIISDIIRYQAEYNCVAWAVEAVQFQEFFRTELIKRAAGCGTPVPAQGVKPHSDKMLRIETLQPHMANSLLLLHTKQKTLIDQFRHFPKADHDDGCDAVEMVWKIATGFVKTSVAESFILPEPSWLPS